jgi:hypothetical protein
MPRTRRSLEREILQVLMWSHAEGHRDVAEHLLRALESLQADCPPGSELAEAYLALCDTPESCDEAGDAAGRRK